MLSAQEADAPPTFPPFSGTEESLGNQVHDRVCGVGRVCSGGLELEAQECMVTARLVKLDDAGLARVVMNTAREGPQVGGRVSSHSPETRQWFWGFLGL